MALSRSRVRTSIWHASDIYLTSISLYRSRVRMALYRSTHDGTEQVQGEDIHLACI